MSDICRCPLKISDDVERELMSIAEHMHMAVEMGKEDKKRETEGSGRKENLTLYHLPRMGKTHCMTG